MGRCKKRFNIVTALLIAIAFVSLYGLFYLYTNWYFIFSQKSTPALSFNTEFVRVKESHFTVLSGDGKEIQNYIFEELQKLDKRLSKLNPIKLNVRDKVIINLCDSKKKSITSRVSGKLVDAARGLLRDHQDKGEGLLLLPFAVERQRHSTIGLGDAAGLVLSLTAPFRFAKLCAL